MNTQNIGSKFAGSLPNLYERYLVPLIFEHFASDLVGRVAEMRPSQVLEVAAGTGVVTRGLATSLPSSTSIVATDLNQPMLDVAASIGTSRTVKWQQADAMDLPFADNTFDVVVCQFGTMFFPDKVQAFREARRVLRPGGALMFNVWDRIEENEFADTVAQSLARLFPSDPPPTTVGVAHGYFNRQVINTDLSHAGFDTLATFETRSMRSRADSPKIPAVAFCQGTPLRSEIEARGHVSLTDATDAAAEAIAARFGAGIVNGKIQAHIIKVYRS